MRVLSFLNGADLVLSAASSKGSPCCVCTGAKQVDGGLLMSIRWDDGFEARVENADLKARSHCKDALIDFYESKIRKVQPSPNTRSRSRH